jgi:hypothetical protein
MNRSALEAYLTECWRTRLFSPSIYPGSPFRKMGWLALAFNRDRQGDQRFPPHLWAALLQSIKTQTAESVAFVCSVDELLGGTTAVQEQPFLIKLELDAVLAHFTSADAYLPEFWMAGASEDWGIWGDSDFTVFGGTPSLMAPVIDVFGDSQGALTAMCADFDVSLDQDSTDEVMRIYLARLVGRL